MFVVNEEDGEVWRVMSSGVVGFGDNCMPINHLTLDLGKRRREEFVKFLKQPKVALVPIHQGITLALGLENCPMHAILDPWASCEDNLFTTEDGG